MRSVTDVTGLRDIRSMHTTGRRSIPRVQSSAYLDLYMLQKEKERLEKEATLLDKRTRAIEKRLRELRKQMEDLERSAQSEHLPSGGEEDTEQRAPTKKWTTFCVNY